MIKSQRFWSKVLRDKVEEANRSIKTRNLAELDRIVNDLITSLKNTQENWKDRVAICFILEQIATIEPVLPKIIDALKLVLTTESDPHVKEFAVWALGKIVEDHRSLELIKTVMPVIVKFFGDDSDQVKNLAKEYHGRLSEYLKVQEGASQQIEELKAKMLGIVQENLDNMKRRSDNLSKEALELNYQTAFEKQQEMKAKIHQFNEANQQLENSLIKFRTDLIQQFPNFEPASEEIFKYWRTQRGEKEDLIRRVDCIIRIQSKIFTIIKFIMAQRPDQPLNLDQIKDLTTQPGRPYSEKEVIEILQQLVNEEIVPNFMLDQIKDYQIKANAILGEEKKPESESKAPESPKPVKETKNAKQSKKS